MEEELIIDKLRGLLNYTRLQHSIRVGKCAEKLAIFYKEDPKKAALAGLLHDCAKGFQSDELLLKCEEYEVELDDISTHEKGLIHGPLGAKLAKDIFRIDDSEILSAIKYHTFGKEDMTLLEKIIYIADLIEPDRSFNGIDELRSLVWTDLDMGILRALENSIISLMAKGKLVHPNTLGARNYIIKGVSKKYII